MQGPCRRKQAVRARDGWPLTNETYGEHQQGFRIFLSVAPPVTINPGEPELAVVESNEHKAACEVSLEDPIAVLYAPSIS